MTLNLLRYALDVTLLTSEKYLLQDGSRTQSNGTVDLSCGILTPLENFSSAIVIACQAIRISRSGKETRGEPPVIKLDGGMSLVCDVDVIAEVLRCLVGEIQSGLGMSGGKGS